MASVLQHKKSPSGFYTFSSRPHVVPSRFRYSDPVMMENEGRPFYGNIMYDRRIVRGNTYAQHILSACILKELCASGSEDVAELNSPFDVLFRGVFQQHPPLLQCITNSQPEPVDVQWQQEAMRRATARKRVKDKFQTRSSGTPEGRKHIDVQTELYLEELSDGIESTSVDCQTDAFLDRPATPLFIPAKSGKDAETQIEEGELFDFDVEVQPVLEVLVGKTMEQALLEVMEEEELAKLRAQQRAFHELRNAELVEVQRLEEEERRRSEEKVRRINQQRLILKKERETAEKIAARAFAQQYLSDLLPSAFANLRERGYFYDPVQRDIETGFLPWLMAEVNNTLEKRQVARTVLDMIIHDVIDQRQELFQNVINK